ADVLFSYEQKEKYENNNTTIQEHLGKIGLVFSFRAKSLSYRDCFFGFGIFFKPYSTDDHGERH
ncbi:hypothetical protein ACMZ6Y_11155, partial [Streptococcus pluranimalium]